MLELTFRASFRTALLIGLVWAAPSLPLAAQSPTEPRTSVPEEDGGAVSSTPESTVLESVPSPEELGLVPGRPRVAPTRGDTAPVIDGVLDDEVWGTAARITQFTQESPLEGAPASEQTDVYLAYDSDHLYFGFNAHYEDPSIMRANRVERDRTSQDDLMTVYLDTFLDQQRGYDFDVNGYGVQGDGIMTAGQRRNRGSRRGIPRADRSWNALFDTGAQIVEDGFTAEMAIPFKSLRYPSPPDGEPHRWGLQIVRQVRGSNQENQVWSPMSRDEASFFAQMSILEGMVDISTSRNLEILPTFTAIQYGEIDPTGPGFRNQDTQPDAGLNVKYGLTSDLTADFTVNPDFSQIESDRPQIEVNQRFPLFFSELRPFFLEGAEIFQVNGPVTVVHTRTIVNPDYGAKLSGQVGRFAVGLLAANDRAPGKVEDSGDPAFDEAAQTFIGRARYDLYAESNLGAIVTDREFLNSHSRVFGLDGNFRLGSTLSSSFQAIGSSNKGVGEEEMAGHMFVVGIIQEGRNVRASLFAHEITPDFETEAGFVRRTDVRNVRGNLGYRFWPESWIINWGPTFEYGQIYDFDGVLQDENRAVRLGFDFARSVSLFSNFNWDMERFEGIDFQKNRFRIGGFVNTGRRYSFGGNFSTGDEIYFLGPFLGHQLSWSLNGTLRPLDRFSSSLRFERRRFTDPTSANEELFDVRILRATTTFQFTDRLGLRNITEINSQDETFDFNVLFNYRVNAGTVFLHGL